MGRIWEISKTKTKISRSRIFDSGAHILFLSSSNMIIIDKPWGKSAQYLCEKIQTLKVPRKSQNSLDFPYIACYCSYLGRNLRSSQNPNRKFPAAGHSRNGFKFWSELALIISKQLLFGENEAHASSGR